MRNKQDFLDLKNIGILWQYLYMDEDNFIIVHNGLSDLKIFMDENFCVWSINVNYPYISPLRQKFEIREWLAMIDILKNQKSSFEGEKESPFQNRWEEICDCVASCVVLNETKKAFKKYTKR